MGKHLFSLKSRTKGKLADGRPIGGAGRLSDPKIKKLQKDYGLAIRQKSIRKSNPTRRKVEVAVYVMEKKKKKKQLQFSITMLSPTTRQSSIDIVPLANRRGVNGSKMKQQELQHIMTVTVCLRSFLKS